MLKKVLFRLLTVLLLAVFLIYLLLAMVIPQVYDSVVGLIQAIPDDIEVVVNGL